MKRSMKNFCFNDLQKERDRYHVRMRIYTEKLRSVVNDIFVNSNKNLHRNRLIIIFMYRNGSHLARQRPKGELSEFHLLLFQLTMALKRCREINKTHRKIIFMSPRIINVLETAVFTT